MYYRAMMSASVRLANRIITDSEFSKRDIVRHLSVDPSLISVVYPGVDEEFHKTSACDRDLSARFGITGDYILYTGIYKLRKNHAGLLRAFREFVAHGGSGQLVIVGPMNEGEAELRALARQLTIEQHLVLTGFVNDAELRDLYSAARVYACPSLYEGFGFTVLEAMACDTPVVCSTATSLPEVAGDAALYADANDEHAFAIALYRAFNDRCLRQGLIEAGHKNLERFSWKRTAAQTLAVFDQAVAIASPKAAFA
jgi:glycosyltransferase involved in cell wall biosynthesis